MTIGGDRPPRFGGDVVAEDRRDFLVAYLEYEQHMHVAHETGGDRVLARRRELVDLATQIMVADKFYDGQPLIDLSELELKKGLETFAGVHVQWTRDMDFCHQICRVLTIDARVPVDNLQKYLAHGGLTDVVKPGGRQYSLKHGKALLEAIAAAIEQFEFRHKVEREMRFNLVVHELDALFIIIDQQRRDQDVIEANDAERRQTPTRRGVRSVVAAGTKLQGNAADKHGGSKSAKTAGVKADKNRGYENNECFACGKQGHKQWDCHQGQQGKGRIGVHGQSHGQAPKQQQQQQQSTSDPGKHTRSKHTGTAPASATHTTGTSGYITASKAVVTVTEPAAPAASTQTGGDYVYTAAAGKHDASGYRAHRDGAAPCFPERWAAKCRTNPSISCGTAADTRVRVVTWRFQHHFVRACLGLAVWQVWRYKRGYGGHRTAFGGTDTACRGASCGSRCVCDC